SAGGHVSRGKRLGNRLPRQPIPKRPATRDEKCDATGKTQRKRNIPFRHRSPFPRGRFAIHRVLPRPKSPTWYRTTAIRVGPTVSARKIRGPNVIGTAPTAASCSTSI